MHYGDLGMTKYFLGAVFFTLFLEMGSIIMKWQAACGKLLTLIKMIARHLGVDPQINSLTLSMF